MCIRDSAKADQTSNFIWVCSFCRLPVAKSTIFGKFWLLGASRSVYSVALWRRKTPIFAIFWTSAFSDVDSWRQSEKVEHGCTTTNLPLSNGIKIISVLQRLHGEIGQTNSDVHKRDEQKSVTDIQKNQRFFANPAAGKIRATPNLVWW